MMFAISPFTLLSFLAAMYLSFFIDTSSSLSGYLFIIVISFPCNHFITISDVYKRQAFNVFARAVVREQGIPFDLKLDTPNKETLDAMEEVRQMKQDTSIGKTYANADEMMEDLLS